MRRLSTIWSASFSGIILASCIGSHSDPNRLVLPPGFDHGSGAAGVGGAGGPTTGQVRMQITDKKFQGFEVKRISVRFRSIEVHKKETRHHGNHRHHHSDDNWVTVADFGAQGKEFDLMKLQDAEHG